MSWVFYCFELAKKIYLMQAIWHVFLPFAELAEVLFSLLCAVLLAANALVVRDYGDCIRTNKIITSQWRSRKKLLSGDMSVQKRI